MHAVLSERPMMREPRSKAALNGSARIATKKQSGLQRMPQARMGIRAHACRQLYEGKRVYRLPIWTLQCASNQPIPAHLLLQFAECGSSDRCCEGCRWIASICQLPASPHFIAALLSSYRPKPAPGPRFFVVSWISSAETTTAVWASMGLVVNPPR